MYISSVSMQKTMTKTVWTKLDSCLYARHCGNWPSLQQKTLLFG